MTERPEILQWIRQWVEKAEEDIINAEHTLTLDRECPVSTICFHAQQCVEKYMKALLVFASVPFPRTHDLLQLFKIIPTHLQPNLKLENLVLLNRYAIETRYPGDWEPIDLSEAQEAVVFANEIRKKIRAFLPEEVL